MGRLRNGTPPITVRRSPRARGMKRWRSAKAMRWWIIALRQRFITLALVLLLTVMGVVSFRNLPIEAYPDVGDVRAEVITLWPGHAAEEVERLITIPLENELNGIARVTVVRSDTLFGLSNIRVVFADATDDY